eukprot:11167298-Alexandrium_andersonii.AAC.1
MSYFHRVQGRLHGNVLTALRRDGYPITLDMFQEAFVGSQTAVEQEAESYIRRFNLGAGSSEIYGLVCAG